MLSLELFDWRLLEVLGWGLLKSPIWNIWEEKENSENSRLCWFSSQEVFRLPVFFTSFSLPMLVCCGSFPVFVSFRREDLEERRGEQYPSVLAKTRSLDHEL